MIITGPILAGFIIYHLLHFTTGHCLAGGLQMTPDGHIDVYANVVKGFRNLPASLIYIASMILLGYHLSHGIWSMFQSVGVSHPRLTPVIKKLALAATIIIVAGNISIPVAVMAGIIR
jgi:succinate dehydrogenase / fumarate reductase cytochrome b subunit